MIAKMCANNDVPKHSPFKIKYTDVYTSFVRQRSVEV